MGLAGLAMLSTAVCAAFAPSSRAAVAPMDYLRADGLMSAKILPLTQALLLVSVVVARAETEGKRPGRQSSR